MKGVKVVEALYYLWVCPNCGDFNIVKPEGIVTCAGCNDDFEVISIETLENE